MTVDTRLPHVSYRAERDSRVSMDSRMLGLPQHDVLKVPSFALLPFLVERSDAIALVQRRVAERFVGLANIAVHAPPVPIEPLHVCAYWSVGHERDAAHGWFRALLREVAEGV